MKVVLFQDAKDLLTEKKIIIIIIISALRQTQQALPSSVSAI